MAAAACSTMAEGTADAVRSGCGRAQMTAGGQRRPAGEGGSARAPAVGRSDASPQAVGGPGPSSACHEDAEPHQRDDGGGRDNVTRFGEAIGTCSLVVERFHPIRYRDIGP